MSNLFEDQLVRMFQVAGRCAPAPPPDFTGQVLDRRRRRQRMRLLRWGGAAGVSLSIVAGLLLLLPPGGRTTALPTVQVSYGTPLDLDRALPADQVWPQAVVRLPSKLADGRGYTALRSIGAGRVIVEPFGGTSGYYPPEIM